MNFLKRSISFLTRNSPKTESMAGESTSPVILPANVRQIPFTLPLQFAPCTVGEYCDCDNAPNIILNAPRDDCNRRSVCYEDQSGLNAAAAAVGK